MPGELFSQENFNEFQTKIKLRAKPDPVGDNGLSLHAYPFLSNMKSSSDFAYKVHHYSQVYDEVERLVENSVATQHLLKTTELRNKLENRYIANANLQKRINALRARMTVFQVRVLQSQVRAYAPSKNVPPGAPHTLLRQPTLSACSPPFPDPKAFNGDSPELFETFCKQVFIKLAMNADCYPTQYHRVAYVVSQLKGEAYELIEKGIRLDGTFTYSNAGEILLALKLAFCGKKKERWDGLHIPERCSLLGQGLMWDTVSFAKLIHRITHYTTF